VYQWKICEVYISTTILLFVVVILTVVVLEVGYFLWLSIKVLVNCSPVLWVETYKFITTFVTGFANNAQN